MRVKRGGRFAATGAFAAVAGLSNPSPAPASTASTTVEPDARRVERLHAIATTTRAQQRWRGDAPVLLSWTPAFRASMDRDRLRDELHFLRHHPNPTSLPEHQARAKRGLAMAESIGDPRLIVRALLALTVTADDEDGKSETLELATRAYDIAAAVDAHGLASQAAALLALHQTDHIDRFNQWIRTAEAHNDLADDPEAEMEIASSLAWVAMDDFDYEEALIVWQRYVGASEEYLGPDHPMTGVLIDTRGMIHQQLGQYEAAEADTRLALDIIEQAPDVAVALGAGTRMGLARLLFEQGEHPEALQELAVARRTVERWADEPGMSDNLWFLHWVTGSFLHALGHEEEAIAHYVVLRDEFPAEAAYNMMTLNATIADAYLDMGRRSGAIEALETALSFTDPDEAEWEERIHIRQQLAELRREAADE